MTNIVFAGDTPTFRPVGQGARFMLYLEIQARGRLVARLKLPSAGLILAGAPPADVVLPGLRGDTKVEPVRQAIWVTRGGDTETLAVDQTFDLGVYSLQAVDASQVDLGVHQPGERTQTLRYDAAETTLTTSRYRLRIIEGPDAPRDVDLDEQAVVIGKHGGCDIHLTDEFVSGRHARLTPAADGWLVSDLESRNGVFVDEVRVTEATLPPDRPLRMGSSVLILQRIDDRETVAPLEQTEFAGMVGASAAMRRVFALVQRVAQSDATALIQGATGSGKELVARALHYRSRRAAGPFVAVNCACLVRELVASELFGHVKGAFTGATSDRPGLFENADGGTVFLDEVAELPLDLQPNLLRVLEDRTVRRVGGKRDIPVDVRVVAASHRDLRGELAAGRFREDLFFRLDMIPIELPPLRDRREDVPLLTAHLLAREAQRVNRAPRRVSDEALAVLVAYHWPGNVRELANVLARAEVLAGAREEIVPEDLLLRPPLGDAGTDPPTLAAAEETLIRQVLAATDSRTAAAARLGIAKSTLYDKIKKYELS